MKSAAAAAHLIEQESHFEQGLGVVVERFQQADTNQPAKCPCAEMQDRYFMSGREPDRAKGWIAARKEGQVGNITIAEPAAPKFGIDRKSTRLNSSHSCATRMPPSA